MKFLINLLLKSLIWPSYFLNQHVPVRYICKLQHSFTATQSANCCFITTPLPSHVPPRVHRFGIAKSSKLDQYPRNTPSSRRKHIFHPHTPHNPWTRVGGYLDASNALSHQMSFLTSAIKLIKSILKLQFKVFQLRRSQFVYFWHHTTKEVHK